MGWTGMGWERTWVHPLHAVGVGPVWIGVIPSQCGFAQAICVGDVAEGVQVVASLAWIGDDCV